MLINRKTSELEEIEFISSIEKKFLSLSTYQKTSLLNSFISLAFNCINTLGINHINDLVKDSSRNKILALNSKIK